MPARLRAMLSALLVAVVALAIYRPDRPLPFDLWDFREFLPILDTHRGFVAGYNALLEYYAGHGRMNPLFYLTFSAQYALFGDHAWAWQVLRFMVMLADALLLLWLARRLRLGWIGAMTATLLFVVGTPAVRAWVQLMAEPLAVGLLLVAAHLALGFRESPHWRWRTTALLGCIAAAFLTKEVAGALGAFIVLLAILGWSRDVGSPDLRSARTVVLALGALIVAACVAVLILEVRSLPEATGYGMAYGQASLSPARFLDNLAATSLPVHPEGRTALGLLYPANILALLLLGLGLASWVERGHSQRVLSRSVVFALGMAAFGSLLYLPWPKFDSFYALPFFVGPALLIGAAVDAMNRAGGRRRMVAGIGSVLMISYTAIPAIRSTEAAMSALQLNTAAIQVIAQLAPTDSVIVFGPADGPRRLPVRAAELHDHAVATHAARVDQMPTVLDRDCAVQVRPSPQVVLMSYSYGCGPFQQPVMRLQSTYRWLDWSSFARMSDTLSIDISGLPIERLRTIER